MSIDQKEWNYKSDELTEGTCFECLTVGPCHEHHVVPKILGGTKTLPLCRGCHGKVHGLDFTNHGNLVKIGLERRKAETGRYGGPHPYGHFPKEKAALAMMLDLRQREGTVRGIADALNASEHHQATRNGRPWHYASVSKILARHLQMSDEDPTFQ